MTTEGEAKRSPMGLACNIDRRGARMRVWSGCILLVGAAGLALGAAFAGWGPIAWIAAAVVGLAGAFGVFEGLNGWCAVRALGFRTPI